jgi:hypothetical protein
MEYFAELMQRLLEIQSGERSRSPELIAEDERLMDGLRKRTSAGEPLQTVNADENSFLGGALPMKSDAAESWKVMEVSFDDWNAKQNPPFRVVEAPTGSRVALSENGAPVAEEYVTLYSKTPFLFLKAHLQAKRERKNRNRLHAVSLSNSDVKQLDTPRAEQECVPGDKSANSPTGGLA